MQTNSSYLRSKTKGVSYIEAAGGELFINSLNTDYPAENVVCVDVETDEKDNFVGCAVTNDGIHINYFTHLGADLRYILETSKLVGHGLKGDVSWLKSWGVNIRPEQIYFDTMIASYVKWPTRKIHGLKMLGQIVLGLKWPTYAEMTGKGRLRRTLDKQPVEWVADYCGMDALVTYRLHEWFKQHHTDNQRRVFNEIEMPLNRLLFKMEQQGIQVNLKQVKELHKQYQSDLLKVEKALVVAAGKEINWNSWQQRKQVLVDNGVKVDTTDKKELLQHKEHPIVQLMLQRSEYAKLVSAFTGPLLEHVKNDGRVHCVFGQLTKNEAGMTTGRLNARNPNLMQIPAHTEDGAKLREVFIPTEGHVLVCADYKQADLRVLAHLSKEPVFVEAFTQGKDIHQTTADLLKIDRQKGKVVNLAYANSVGAGRLSEQLDIPYEDAKGVLEKFNVEMPTLARWRKNTLDRARDIGGVVALHRWYVPISNLKERDWKKRGYAERQAISVLVQGGTAIVMKLAMLELNKQCPWFTQLIQVHDEVVGELEADTGLGEHLIKQIEHTMEKVPQNSLGILLPFKVDIGYGKSWKEAKA